MSPRGPRCVVGRRCVREAQQQLGGQAKQQKPCKAHLSAYDMSSSQRTHTRPWPSRPRGSFRHSSATASAGAEQAASANYIQEPSMKEP